MQVNIISLVLIIIYFASSSLSNLTVEKKAGNNACVEHEMPSEAEGDTESEGHKKEVEKQKFESYNAHSENNKTLLINEEYFSYSHSIIYSEYLDTFSPPPDL